MSVFKKTLKKKLENCLLKWQHTIEYGKSLPIFIQPTYWETNKIYLDELDAKIKNLQNQILTIIRNSMYKNQTFKHYYRNTLINQGYTVKEIEEIIKKEKKINRDFEKNKVKTKELAFLKDLDIEFSSYKDADLSAKELIERYFKQVKI
jgi:hypothetical protein